MKILLFILLLPSLLWAQGDKGDCQWVDSGFSKSPLYSKTRKKSKGWIFCEKSNLASLVLEKNIKSKEGWVKKYVKESFPSNESITYIKKTPLAFADRWVVQASSSNNTFDLLFFFVKGKKNNFVFSSIMLERPYKEDLELATKEVEKLLKKKPELLK